MVKNNIRQWEYDSHISIRYAELYTVRYYRRRHRQWRMGEQNHRSIAEPQADHSRLGSGQVSALGAELAGI